ncbi:MAG: tryptophan-rich sensory protein [Oscillospiraceae bacterium]|nr:tryptophan-rich sensory protein [Oscillospiraceae bacterium]
MKKKQITELLLFIVATELVGALSALLTGKAFSFYQEIAKPPFSPPGWVFPVMWAILYAVMGISVFLIFRTDQNVENAGKPGKRSAYLLYTVQLAVNFSWSIVFFRFQMLGLSVVVILLLLVLLVAMIITFFKIRRSAAYLNIPYFLWILFASYLNIGVLILN